MCVRGCKFIGKKSLLERLCYETLLKYALVMQKCEMNIDRSVGRSVGGSVRANGKWWMKPWAKNVQAKSKISENNRILCRFVRRTEESEQGKCLLLKAIAIGMCLSILIRMLMPMLMPMPMPMPMSLSVCWCQCLHECWVYKCTIRFAKTHSTKTIPLKMAGSTIWNKKKRKKRKEECIVIRLVRFVRNRRANT